MGVFQRPMKTGCINRQGFDLHPNRGRRAKEHAGQPSLGCPWVRPGSCVDGMGASWNLGDNWYLQCDATARRSFGGRHVDVIERFVAEYEREYDYWDAAARTVRVLLENDLNTSGLRAIVTSRAKSVDRLEEKLRQRDRNRDEPYATTAQIRADIADLAGVRVALYFPGQMDEVERVINGALNVNHTKRFPEPVVADGERDSVDLPRRRFSGYAARHYRVAIPAAALADGHIRYASAVIEVQVASVLMHAWSEVEHDLIYKPREGRLSEPEYALLDQVNGLVLAGEIALEQLERAADDRVSAASTSFRDHYELAEFLRSRLGPQASDKTLGRIDILFEFLEELGLATAKELQPSVDRLRKDAEQRPLAEKLADLLLADDPQRLRAYRAAIAKATSKTRHPSAKPAEGRATAIGAASFERFVEFLKAWNDLELELAGRLGDQADPSFSANLRRAEEMQLLPLEDVMILQKIRELRGDVVHRPTRAFSDEASQKWTPRLREISQRLRVARSTE